MKYAENIKDISNAFKQGPLDEKDMDEFYYPSTMETIRVIYEACQLPSERNVFLLLGHKVLGKEHPDTATTYYNMALLYEIQGENDKALEYCKKASKVFEL